MKKVNCIFLIDDNEADNDFHKMMITEADVCHQLKIFSSAQEALTYIKKYGEPNDGEISLRPDFIFLDIYMPGMNGFDFLDKFSALDDRLKSNAKVIILTTSLNSDDREKASTYKEVIGFHNKPLTSEIAQMMAEVYF